MRRLRVALVGWPILTSAGIVAGALVHMRGPGDVHFWPPVFFAVLHALCAVLVLRPLAAPTTARADARVREALERASVRERPLATVPAAAHG